MGFWGKLFGGGKSAKDDAQPLYHALLRQARKPEFYGENRIPDNYDGRIDVLTLHMAALLKALSSHGEQGQRLSQAVFDEMKDDFEIALREEGLSDAGVKRRIKPMISLFYKRIKTYHQGLAADDPKSALGDGFTEFYGDGIAKGAPELAKYLTSLMDEMATKSIGELALAQFSFPPLGRK